jgi:hypothetical protein
VEHRGVLVRRRDAEAPVHKAWIASHAVLLARMILITSSMSQTA